MKHSVTLLCLCLIFALSFYFYMAKKTSALPGSFDVTAPVVVELFTSQSCSSCPPADRILQQLVQNENVIGFSCNVTYWNHLSWKDTLSHDFCSGRQGDYSGNGRVFTPEIRINGQDSLVGSNGAGVAAAIAKQAGQLARIDIRQSSTGYQAMLPAIEAGQYTINLVFYAADHVQKIRSGENGGSTVTYTRPVIKILPVGATWQGTQNTMKVDAAQVPATAAGLIVLAQQGTATGPIRAAGHYSFSR